MNNLLTCSNCGNEIKEYDPLCYNCGQKLPLKRFFSFQLIKDYSHLFSISFIAVVGLEALGTITNSIISILNTTTSTNSNNLILYILNSLPFATFIIGLYIYFLKANFLIPKILFKKILIYEFGIGYLGIVIGEFFTNLLSSNIGNFFSITSISFGLIGAVITTIIFALLIEMNLDYAR